MACFILVLVRIFIWELRYLVLVAGDDVLVQ